MWTKIAGTPQECKAIAVGLLYRNVKIYEFIIVIDFNGLLIESVSSVI